MDVAQVLTIVAQYGPFAVMTVVVFLSYEKLVVRLAVLIEANTSAIQSMRDVAAQNCADLKDHDGRITGTLGAIDRIEGAVQRIESKINMVHEVVSTRRQPAR